MCLMVYMAADTELETRPFDPERPGFHVTEVREADLVLSRHFSKPVMRVLQAHEGCGCGFQYGRHPEFPVSDEGDPEGLALADACRQAAEEYVRAVLTRTPSVEIYACWDGDQALEPISHRLTDSPAFPDGFVERELLTVASPAA